MNIKRLGTAALLLTGAFAASTAIAAKAGGFIGLGAGYGPDYEGSDDYEAMPALFGRYNWASGRFIDLSGTSGSERAARLRANLIPESWSGTWTAGPLLQYRLERSDSDDDKVDDMQDVDAATEAGAFVGFKLDRWAATLSFAGDVSDEYNGYLVYLKGGYDLPVNDDLKLTLGAHLTYADSDYMETYFGVNAKDARRSGLPRYSADSGLKDWGLSVTGRYSFTDTWGMLASVGYTRLMNDAEDSPLVDDRGDDNQVKGALAVTYSF